MPWVFVVNSLIDLNVQRRVHTSEHVWNHTAHETVVDPDSVARQGKKVFSEDCMRIIYPNTDTDPEDSTTPQPGETPETQVELPAPPTSTPSSEPVTLHSELEQLRHQIPPTNPTFRSLSNSGRCTLGTQLALVQDPLVRELAVLRGS